MSTVDLSRFQFAMTSIYHFLFVPVTIGLAVLTAVLHTAWYLRRDEGYLRLTRFFGTLLVINIAVGVVTGLVQEFQFGMNWADYSRFVGDVFGAPLAIEGLAAFFLESTFLGLWLFGWGRPRPGCTWPRSGWSRSAHCCRPRSSWRRTRGCSTRWATSSRTGGRS
jgi:cytochrome d ubiquinol oxidase subunit I